MDSERGANPVQKHIAHTSNKFFDTSRDVVWYGSTVDPATHSSVVPPKGRRGYPDVYVNKDVTVTVDPIKNAHWVRDDSHRHPASVHKGALKDHAGVMRAVSIIKKGSKVPRTYMPTTKDIDRLDKYSSLDISNSTRGHHYPSRPGKLPGFTKMIYDGDLYRMTYTTETERLQYAPARDRRFDCSGPCR